MGGGRPFGRPFSHPGVQRRQQGPTQQSLRYDVGALVTAARSTSRCFHKL